MLCSSLSSTLVAGVLRGHRFLLFLPSTSALHLNQDVAIKDIVPCSSSYITLAEVLKEKTEHSDLSNIQQRKACVSDELHAGDHGSTAHGTTAGTLLENPVEKEPSSQDMDEPRKSQRSQFFETTGKFNVDTMYLRGEKAWITEREILQYTVLI